MICNDLGPSYWAREIPWNFLNCRDKWNSIHSNGGEAYQIRYGTVKVEQSKIARKASRRIVIHHRKTSNTKCLLYRTADLEWIFWHGQSNGKRHDIFILSPHEVNWNFPSVIKFQISDHNFVRISNLSLSRAWCMTFPVSVYCSLWRWPSSRMLRRVVS